MPSSELLSQTLNEIKGIFIPGHPTAIFCGSQSLITPDITAKHELAHLWLCNNSSFGRFITTLTTIEKTGTDKSSKEAAGALLKIAIDNCWMTHEGCATAAQLSYCNLMQRNDLLPAENYLPKSYLLALNKFTLKRDFVLSVLKTLGVTAADKLFLPSYYAVAHGYIEVLAIAAMSPPISNFMSSALDPLGYETSRFIRDNSPDARLDRLINRIDSKLTTHCVTEYFNLSCSDPKNDSFLVNLANLTKELAKLIADHANIPFESDKLFIEDVLMSKYCCHGAEVETKRIESDIEIIEVANRNYIISECEDLSVLVGLDMPAADAAYGMLLSEIPESERHVVCEIFLLKSDKLGLKICLHVFIDKSSFLSLICKSDRYTLDIVQLEEYTGLDSRTAIQFALIFMHIDLDDIYTIRDTFKSGTWTWLIDNGFWSSEGVSKEKDFVVNSKERVYIHSATINDKVSVQYAHIPISPSAATLAFAPISNGQVNKNGIALVTPESEFIHPFPHGLCILFYDSNEKKEGVYEVVLRASALSVPNSVCCDSFHASCVAMAVYQGINSCISRRAINTVLGAANE